MHEKLTHEFIESSIDLLIQSMKKIEHCCQQLDANQVWWRPAPGLNSVGILISHLAGNLQQWGVVPFAKLADTRDRAAEFQDNPEMTETQLLENLNAVVADAKQQWANVSGEMLIEPAQIQGFNVTYLQAISHASSHFVGHTHQIIQLTRLQLADQYEFHWKPADDRSELPI